MIHNSVDRYGNAGGRNFHGYFPGVGRCRFVFSNRWNFSGPFFQSLEVLGPLFPVIGKRGLGGRAIQKTV